MCNRRPLRSLACLAFLIVIAPGCQALHAYRSVPVEVRDAETKKPIAEADVHITYPLSNSALAPWESEGKTGKDGIALMQAAAYGDAGIMVDVTARNYLNEQKFLTIQEVQNFEVQLSGLFMQESAPRKAKYIVELHAAPRPTIELVVPAGYQGMVKARILIRDDATCPPGQRNFSFTVPESGEIVVTGPPLFRHVIPTDLRVRFADKTPISRQGQDRLLGYWWIKSESSYNYLLVGTQRTFEEYRRSLLDRRVVDRGSGATGLTGGRDWRNPPALPSVGQMVSPAGRMTTPALFERSALDAQPDDVGAGRVRR